MWSKTTFEWNGHGLWNLEVKNFGSSDKGTAFLVRNLDVWIENNRNGHLDVEFGPVGRGDISRGVIELVGKLFVKFGPCSYVKVDGSLYKFTFGPVNGENITVTMAKNLFLFLEMCGIAAPMTAPRIVTENFKGRFCGDIRPEKSYGQKLFEDLQPELKVK